MLFNNDYRTWQSEVVILPICSSLEIDIQHFLCMAFSMKTGNYVFYL